MNMYDDYIGTQVIIRSADSGVHYGTLVAVDGAAVRLKDSRRLWEWRTANDGICLTDIALAGIDPKHSRIAPVQTDMIVMGVCEISETHGLCRASIEGAPDAKAT